MGGGVTNKFLRKKMSLFVQGERTPRRGVSTVFVKGEVFYGK